MADCSYNDNCVAREEYERNAKTHFMVCDECEWPYRIFEGELDMFCKEGCPSCGDKKQILKLKEK